MMKYVCWTVSIATTQIALHSGSSIARYAQHIACHAVMQTTLQQQVAYPAFACFHCFLASHVLAGLMHYGAVYMHDVALRSLS